MSDQEYKRYIEKMKRIYECILEYIRADDDEENYQNLQNVIKEFNILTNREDMKTIFNILIEISNNYRRKNNFFEKIEQILQIFKKVIPKYFSNSEIFCLFKRSKRILLYIIKEDLLTLDKTIVWEMIINFSLYKYPEYFSKEIKPLIDEEMKEKYRKLYQKTENHIYNNNNNNNKYNLIEEIFKEEPEDFEEKRKEGINDETLCELIRKDLLKDFIIYISRKNYSLTNSVSQSIYETNKLLMVKNASLIQYAAFYGSAQIFQYLRREGNELDNSIWIYAIHGENDEIIHYLEDNNINPPNNTYESCIKESIKSHNHLMFNYIENNLIDEKYENYDQNIISYCFNFYNFAYFPEEINTKYIFSYACKYGYLTIVNYLINSGNIDTSEESIILIKLFNKNCLKLAAKNDNQEIMNILSTYIKIDRIDFILSNKLTQFTIPNSVVSIENNSFNGCKSLTKISIPSSVEYIGEWCFGQCLMLNEVIFEHPSSLHKIESYIFFGCSFLAKITIPSSVTSIGRWAFSGCTLLSEITFEEPVSLVSIEEDAFYDCESLIKLTIPSSVVTIGKFAFSNCSSLKEVTIPSSVKMIGMQAFGLCSSLEEITIPSSVETLGAGTFYRTNSLKILKIPSSLKQINLGLESNTKTKVIRT
ncbi:hypothetical protein M9Y10_017930 [Tritrichomonas musculus]|uniref:Uncharacterized protein n=1 Tax=Tritrichomonas musculus TaxID=1915356 RepID=A0ABR2HUW2_9EUKA